MGVSHLFMRWVMRRSICSTFRSNASPLSCYTDKMSSVLVMASTGTTYSAGKATRYSALSMLAAQATGAKSF